MAHHAPLPGDPGPDRHGDPGPRVSVRAVPPQLARARDELFEDADRHGPRFRVLLARVLPAIALLAASLLLTIAAPWRELVTELASPRVADLVLVAPVLASIVLLGAAMAPLARVGAPQLLALGAVLLAAGAALVGDGHVFAAAGPSILGALAVGVASARVVRRAVWALPLLLAAGISDAHSVAFGVTGALVGDAGAATAPVQLAATTSIAPALVERLDLLVLHVPVATGTWLLGIVDVVAIGLLLGLAHLYWRPVPRTALALALALVLAVAIDGVVPVLPLLGVAWVVANGSLVWRSTRFSLRRLTYLGG
jgi:hypothetical protein